MRALIRGFARNTAGATAIEYGFLACLIALVLIGALTTIGTNLQRPFAAAANGLQ